MPPDEHRVEIYVDDPLLCAGGNTQRRTFLFTVALLTITLVGFPMAWSKGVLGKDVQWIGARLTVVPKGVQIAIPEDKLAALQEQARELQTSGVTSKRVLRAFCGKLSFVAGMVPLLRPFVRMVWAALASTSRLPAELVHVRKFLIALEWLTALFRGFHGPLVRTFNLKDAKADDGDYLSTDASPWGFAGVLFRNHQPVAWFATPIPAEVLRRFQAKVGDSSFNTLWEALAILVALRIWLPGTHVMARVRSDSLSALRSIVKLQSASANLNVIAREIALDATLGLYRIGVAIHIPGVSNTLPDDLSRMWAPGTNAHSMPQQLLNVPQHAVPHLGREFWKSAQPRRRGGQAQARRQQTR